MNELSVPTAKKKPVFRLCKHLAEQMKLTRSDNYTNM